MSTAFITKTDVKNYLQINSTDTKNDTLLDSLIPAAQDFIEEYCSTKFEKLARTEYHKGGSNQIFLKEYPVDKTQTISVWDDWQREYGSDTLIDSDDYFVDEDTGVITFDYEVGGQAGSVKVTYTGGSLPNPIKQACIEMVARKLKEGVSGALGVPSRAIHAGETVTFVVDDILPQTRVVLDKYRRMN
jgi:hypothetical protein